MNFFNKIKLGCVLIFMIAASVYAARREDVDLTVWRIKGVEVTPTAAQLNQVPDILDVVAKEGTSTAASIVLPEGTDNGSHTLTIQPSASLSENVAGINGTLTVSNLNTITVVGGVIVSYTE